MPNQGHQAQKRPSPRSFTMLLGLDPSLDYQQFQYLENMRPVVIIIIKHRHNHLDLTRYASHVYPLTNLFLNGCHHQLHSPFYEFHIESFPHPERFYLVKKLLRLQLYPFPAPHPPPSPNQSPPSPFTPSELGACLMNPCEPYLYFGTEKGVCRSTLKTCF